MTFDLHRWETIKSGEDWFLFDHELKAIILGPVEHTTKLIVVEALAEGKIKPEELLQMYRANEMGKSVCHKCGAPKG